jgi:hypothetical protein
MRSVRTPTWRLLVARSRFCPEAHGRLSFAYGEALEGGGSGDSSRGSEVGGSADPPHKGIG